MALQIKVNVQDALTKGAHWHVRGAGNNGQIGKVTLQGIGSMFVNGKNLPSYKLLIPAHSVTVTDPVMLAAILARTENVTFSVKREPQMLNVSNATALGISEADIKAITEADVKAANEMFGA